MYYRRERGLHEAEGETEQKEHVLTFSGNRSEGRLPGLEPYSLYNLSIRVLNSKGEGPPSLSKRFETLEGGVYCWHGFPASLKHHGSPESLICSARRIYMTSIVCFHIHLNTEIHDKVPCNIQMSTVVLFCFQSQGLLLF